MKVVSAVLAHLARGMKGNARQEAGDTSLTVPNVIQPVIIAPEPFTFFFSVADAGQRTRSFIHTDQRPFNLNSTTILNQVGPGNWEIEYAHWVTAEGAVNDNTSNVRLQMVLADGTGSTVDLTRFVNSGLTFQSLMGRFHITLPSDQALTFQVNTVLGAGTGTNRSHLRITAIRML